MTSIKSDSEGIDPSELDEPFDALLREGEALSEQSRKAILEAGDEAVQPLVSVLCNRDLWDEEAPGDGWAPIHAAELLGELGASEALEAMYDALHEVDSDAILDTVLTRSIQEFGEAAIEPGLEALDRFGGEFGDDLASVFAELDVRRKVVFQILLKNLVDNPMLGARNLARYGDPEGLDALHPMLNRLLLAAAEDPRRVEETVAVAEAIEELGGELNANQEDQLDLLEQKKGHAHDVLERVKKGIGDHHHPDTHVKEHDIGRNEPCWCGSGKKYKHCHWKEDHR